MVKKAMLYCRVSSDEQAIGYSLDYQEERLNEYCKHNDIEPVVTFREDASGKTIDKRPELKKALEYAKKNKKEISFFIVLKWDRFSRSQYDSLTLLRTFDSLGISVKAVEQPYDQNVPEQQLMLAIYTAFPEAENRRRAMNIKSAIRKARKDGRYCSNAPWGYTYKKDSTGRKILTPDEHAPAVADIFAKYATGDYTLEQLRTYCSKQHGRKWSENYLKKNMLINPLYAGMVLVPKSEDEPEQIVDGLHEPIIDKSLFHIVQLRLKNKKRALRFSEKLEIYPLRGYLYCQVCGRVMTASRSKGKTKYYHYYHCQDGCKTRVQNETAHQAVYELISQYKMTPARAEILKKMIRNTVEQQNAVIKKRINEISTGLALIEQKLLEIDMRYVEKSIETESFVRLKQKYDRDRADLIKESGSIYKYSTSNSEQIETVFNLLINIENLYNQNSADIKRELISSMFSGYIVFDGQSYRTPKINPALLTLCNININLQITKTKPNLKNEIGLGSVDIEALTSNLFLEGMNEIYKLKPLLNVS